MNLLSICRSLSGVRPMMKRPGVSSRSAIVWPLKPTRMRPSVTRRCDPGIDAVQMRRACACAAERQRRRSLIERSAYSTHCNSSIAARMSSTVTTSRSWAKAAIIAVSHSVLTRRGMPPV